MNSMDFKLLLLIFGALEVFGNTTTDSEYYYPDDDNGALLIKSLFYKINTLLLENDEIKKQFLDMNKQFLDINKQLLDMNKQLLDTNKRLDDQTELLKNIPTKNDNDCKLELQTAYQKEKNQTELFEKLLKEKDDLSIELQNVKDRLDDQTELLKNIQTKNDNDCKLELQTAYQKEKNQTELFEKLLKEKDDLSIQLQNVKDSLEVPLKSDDLKNQWEKEAFLSMHRSKRQDYIKEKNLDKNSQNQTSDWIVIQRREDGTVNFNRLWKDYKKGFGDPKGEFFIGLEKLHKMTTSGVAHELLIVLKDSDNETRYAKYDRFAIDSEKEKYAIIELGEYIGDAGDSLRIHSGKKFSTSEQYTEGSYNCAYIYTGGWWFDSLEEGCCESNLNGNYSGIIPRIGIIWKHWHGYYYSLKFSEMMIRPKQ